MSTLTLIFADDEVRRIEAEAFETVYQAAQRQARQLGDRAGQRRQRVGGEPALAVLVADIDLQQHVQRRQVVRTLLVQAPRDAFAVDGMHPVEMTRDVGGLVALDGTDEMPRNVEPGEFVLFRACLLQVILAEGPLAAVVDGADQRRRMTLADGNEADAAGFAPVTAFEFAQFAEDLLEALGDGGVVVSRLGHSRVAGQRHGAGRSHGRIRGMPAWILLKFWLK